LETPPKVIDVEVVREPGEGRGPAESTPVTSFSRPPIHPLSALLLLVVDNLWNIPEFLVIDWPITIPLSFFCVFAPTFFIQKLLRKDSAGRAFAYALLLGAIAAVPTSVTGTPVGLAILAWTGISHLIGKPLTRE
jgi:hypothetical protein